MKRNILIWVLCIVLLSTFVFARPPFENTELTTGLTIQKLNYEVHPINTELYLHSHVYDTDTGLIIENDTLLICYYHLYSDVVNWEHLTTGVYDIYGAGVFVRVNETYFNESGSYAVLTWCDYNNVKGGFIQTSFVIEESLQSITNANHYIFIILIVGFIALGLLFNNWFGLLGGLLTLIYSFNLFAISTGLGIIVLGGSIILFMGFALKEL